MEGAVSMSIPSSTGGGVGVIAGNTRVSFADGGGAIVGEFVPCGGSVIRGWKPVARAAQAAPWRPLLYSWMLLGVRVWRVPSLGKLSAGYPGCGG